MWVREDIELEQVPIDSSDLTVVILHLPETTVLAVSVYIECSNGKELLKMTRLTRKAVNDAQSKWGNIEVILAGDFNRQDLLWGGDNINGQ